MNKVAPTDLIEALARAGVSDPAEILARLNAGNLANIASLRASMGGEETPASPQAKPEERLTVTAEEGLWPFPKPPRSNDWAFE